jgi:hypothetical protein
VCYFSVDPIRYKTDQQPHHGPQNATRTTGTGGNKKTGRPMPTQPQPSCEVARLALAAYNHGTIMQRSGVPASPLCCIAGTCLIRRRIAAFLQFWGDAFAGGEKEGCPISRRPQSEPE